MPNRHIKSFHLLLGLKLQISFPSHPEFPPFISWVWIHPRLRTTDLSVHINDRSPYWWEWKYFSYCDDPHTLPTSIVFQYIDVHLVLAATRTPAHLSSFPARITTPTAAAGGLLHPPVHAQPLSQMQRVFAAESSHLHLHRHSRALMGTGTPWPVHSVSQLYHVLVFVANFGFHCN